MLSEDLQSLAERLRQFRQTGVSLTPGGIASVCAILEAGAADARTLEASTAKKPCLQLTRRAEPDAVVDFAREKARREIVTFIEGQGVEILPPDDGPKGAA